MAERVVPKFQFKVSMPQAPKGEEAIAKTLELTTKALVTTYPQIIDGFDGADPVFPRLITQPNHIKVVSQQEVRDVRETVSSKLFLLRMLELKHIGFSHGVATELVGASIDEPFFHSFADDKPEFIVSEGFISNLLSEDPIERLEEMLKLGRFLMEANFNRIPKEIELQGLPRQSAKFELRRKLVALTDMAENRMDKFTDDAVFNYMVGLLSMDQLVGAEDYRYRPRVVSYGGLLAFGFPLQNIDDIELVANSEFHKNSYFYLIEPVQKVFLGMVSNAGYTQGRKTEVSRDIATGSAKVRARLQALGLMDRNDLFNEFATSKLGETNLQVTL